MYRGAFPTMRGGMLSGYSFYSVMLHTITSNNSTRQTIHTYTLPLKASHCTHLQAHYYMWHDVRGLRHEYLFYPSLCSCLVLPDKMGLFWSNFIVSMHDENYTPPPHTANKISLGSGTDSQALLLPIVLIFKALGLTPHRHTKVYRKIHPQACTYKIRSKPQIHA
jgi:hypothetical protein